MPAPVSPTVVARLRAPAETDSVRFHCGTSGPASGSWIAMASPGPLVTSDGRSGATRTTPDGTSRVACRPSDGAEVSPCRSSAVAVAVTRGQAGGQGERDREGRLSTRIGRHVHRAQPVLRHARWIVGVAGAGIDVNAVRQVGTAPAEPALELSPGVDGHHDRQPATAGDREGLDVEVSSGIAEDAIGGDHVAGAGVRRDGNARPAIAGDQVTSDPHRPSDRVVGGPEVDRDATLPIRQAQASARVGADVIPLDIVGQRPRVIRMP